jgi:hypothetical protein
MAVPFIGKDVPSHSSEFAHPDVVIGLSILAYRYEGVRRSDLHRLVSQLKADFTRQVGPRDRRPAAMLFREWVVASAVAAKVSSPREAATDGATESMPVLPLPLFQPADPTQMLRLHAMVRRVPQLVAYYLRQHVFPACMNFQKLKISACGHELGSSMLFSKRIGFSGTPSNLLPLDLGECQYEAGSDGRVIACLTSPDVTTATFPEEWSVRGLLTNIAKAQPPFHALIDTGALITGMDNSEVAAFLLLHLPPWFEGVVFLDKSDRQMVARRGGTGRLVALAQCGIPPDRRFTFYDQVHTTGMDIKQAPIARAVLTIGKDMTFRDYSQGAYRMRGIGRGQRIHLIVIPEVAARITQELARPSGRPELDVPAWLLVNSLRVHALQFVQLSIQELHNMWRKRALRALVDEVHAAPADMSEGERLRRFVLRGCGEGEPESKHSEVEKDILWRRRCVSEFREPISFVVPGEVPIPRPFAVKMEALLDEHLAMTAEADAARVAAVRSKAVAVSEAIVAAPDAELNAEVVHEQEAEEEAEEEAQQEEQRASAFCRDDEQPNPWETTLLRKKPTLAGGEDPFITFSSFRIGEGVPTLPFPPNVLLTDNFFRASWIGMGDRRLKNVGLVVEWCPDAGNVQWRRTLHPLRSKLLEEGADADTVTMEAWGRILQSMSLPVEETRSLLPEGTLHAIQPRRYIVAVSLAEGETLRRLIHTRAHVLRGVGLAVRDSCGRLLDASERFETEGMCTGRESLLGLGKLPVIEPPFSVVALGITALKFFNAEMWYTPEELTALLSALEKSPPAARLQWFESAARLRPRERHLWGDTPLAKVFTPEEEWGELAGRAMLELVNEAVRARRLNPMEFFHRFDGTNVAMLTYEEAARAFDAMHLGFSPADIATVTRLADTNSDGFVDEHEFATAFGVPDEILAREAERAARLEASKTLTAMEQRWKCANCTYLNAMQDHTCAMCEMGWTGEREVPTGKWVCSPEQGGCSFFNPLASFYCTMCDRCRPDLASVRF